MVDTPRPRLGDISEILAPAQILLVSRGGPFGWAIQRTTNSRWTHAALIDQTSGGLWIVVEAIAPGVYGTRLEHYLEDPAYRAIAILDVPKLTQAQRDRILEVAWLSVGQGYDLWGCAGILVKRRLGLEIGRRMDAKGRRFCSEIVSFAFEQGASWDLVPGQPTGQTAPGDFYTRPFVRLLWEWPT